jgi:hypothetical protein
MNILQLVMAAGSMHHAGTGRVFVADFVVPGNANVMTPRINGINDFRRWAILP